MDQFFGETSTVNLTAADGTAADTLSVTLASVWSTVAGAPVDVGRLDVVPADGDGAVAATALRTDRITLTPTRSSPS